MDRTHCSLVSADVTVVTLFQVHEFVCLSPHYPKVIWSSVPPVMFQIQPQTFHVMMLEKPQFPVDVTEAIYNAP